MKLNFRDPISGLTHFIGALLAVAGTVLFIVETTTPFKPWHFSSLLTFGIGLILLYTASTLYHWLPLSENGIRQLKRIDHIMIFVLIASSYTPICLIAMRDNWGWPLFIAVWSIAFVGIFLKIFWLNAPRWFSTILYLAMGWTVVIAIYPLYMSVPGKALLWIAMGGCFIRLGGLSMVLKSRIPGPMCLVSMRYLYFCDARKRISFLGDVWLFIRNAWLRFWILE